MVKKNQLVNKTISFLRWFPVKNIVYILQTKIRKCKCCENLSLIISLGKGEESKRCIFCLANLRYEIISEYVKKEFANNLSTTNILELDFNSPLKNLLQNSKEYIMTYYSPFDMVGTFKNGIRCEDITNLTFENDKFDLIVSSDVLEHVHNIEQAFRESARVLKKGGIHLFTVPIHDGLTFKRCEFVNDELHHIVEPEYHYDPLNKNGCIVFWTFGTDITDYFINEAFKIDIVSGPQGIDKRYLLALKKI